MFRHWLLVGFICASLSNIGCRSAYYSMMEKAGVYKRDLLKKKVAAARDEQKEAGQQFKDALTRIRELYGFEGGNLEKTYNALKHDYERSAEKAEAVRKRIKDVEVVSADLFNEWENEIKQISSSDLQSSSRRQLRETRNRYDELHVALKRAEQGMEPILIKFRDQVLFLKHNLNSQAIASLKGESGNIQAEIARLITEMNASIEQADKFIRGMP
jgi:hypothetical protein